MPRPKKSKSATVVLEPLYNISVNVLGRVYKASGKTISEALASFDIKNVKGRSILSVEHNGAKKERILMPAQTFRLFGGHGLFKEVAIKNTSLLFDGI